MNNKVYFLQVGFKEQIGSLEYALNSLKALYNAVAVAE